MFIVVTKPCGCSSYGEHNHPNCPIVKDRRRADERIKKFVDKFRKAIEQ
jgi:hypothetical protein